MSALGKYLARAFDFEEDLRRILAGKGVIDLEDAFFLSPDNPFKKTTQRVLQFGLTQTSKGKVKKVEPGSEAEAAGLQVGD